MSLTSADESQRSALRHRSSARSSSSTSLSDGSPGGTATRGRPGRQGLRRSDRPGRDQLGELTTVIGQGDQHGYRTPAVGHLDLLPVAHSIEVTAQLITKLAYTDLLCHDHHRMAQ